MDKAVYAIVGAVGLMALGVFISSEIQRKQGMTDAEISSRDNNKGFALWIGIVFLVFVVLMLIKGEM